MSELTPEEMARTRGRMSWVVVASFGAVGILAISIACGKKGETPSGASAPAAATAPAAAAAPVATAATEEAPSFKETAAAGGEPYSAVKAPFDGAMDDQGRLWILDSANGRVRVFDARGGYLGGWGGTVENGQYSFRGPEGIAIAGNRVYIADTWGGAVRAYSLKGEAAGRAAGLYGPRGIAASHDGVWVTDTGNGRVMAYDAELKNPREIGKTGTARGEFNGPVGIAVAPSGEVFIGDSANGRIQVLGKDGRVTNSWDLPWLKKSWQAHLAADSHGTVYVSYPDGGQILAFDRSGRQQKVWTADSAGTKFIRPLGMVVDARQGVMFVMDVGSRKVLKIALPGAAAR